MIGLFEDPWIMVAALIAASAIGGLIGFILRGWYEDGQRAREWRAVRSGVTHPSGPAPEPRTTRPPTRARVPEPWSRPEPEADGEAVVVGVTRDEDRPVVLLVDDRLELLALHGSYLHRHGYTVLTADNGDAALELARSHHPGVIILDHSMPRRTGIEVGRELKRDPSTSTIPLLLMTAHSYGAVGSAAKEAGFDTFLPKPVDPSRMLREIAALVPPR